MNSCVLGALTFQGTYLGVDGVRWNLGFPNPNFAGCFVACAIPWIWLWGDALLPSSSSNKNARRAWTYIWLLAAEVPTYYALGRTGSRGGAVAAVSSILVIAALWRRRATQNDAQSIISVLCGRIGLFLSTLAVSDVMGRARGALAGGDLSTANRLSLWKSATEMIAASPISGWGSGESGRAYLNWFQDASRTEGYITPVNSYLHIAVEFGLIPLWLICFSLSAIFVFKDFARTEPREERPLSAVTVAAAASIVAYLVANAFTTLWTDIRLLIIPALSSCFLVGRWMGLSSRSKTRSCIVGAVGATSVVICLYCVGMYFSAGRSITISPDGNGGVRVRKKISSGADMRVVMYPDQRVLGRDPGKEIRLWLLNEPRIQEVYVPAESSGKTGASSDEVVLFGKEAERCSDLQHVRRLVVFHPDSPVVVGVPNATVSLVLPEIDETGYAGQWRSWAELNHIPIITSSLCGQDVRSLWPDAGSIFSRQKGIDTAALP